VAEAAVRLYPEVRGWKPKFAAPAIAGDDPADDKPAIAEAGVGDGYIAGGEVLANGTGRNRAAARRVIDLAGAIATLDEDAREKAKVRRTTG